MARNPPRSPSNSLYDPPAPGDPPTSYEKKSDLKKPSFWVNVITLIVVGFYTFYASQQVTQTQTANGIAKRALAEANKPYVMLASLNPNYTNDVNGVHLRIGFSLNNFGNTPAHFVR